MNQIASLIQKTKLLTVKFISVKILQFLYGSCFALVSIAKNIEE